MTVDRRRSVGARGEQLAAEHLERRGFTIVERNFRTRWGELDIIACDGAALVFCEVKTLRGVPGTHDPLEAVRSGKQVRLRRMAAQWLAARSERPRARELRFDAIGVRLAASGRLLELNHLERAF